MKLNILNYRVNTTHDLISPLNQIAELVSISDYHAFVYDPAGLHIGGVTAVDADRRKSEVRDLLSKKGGIVLAFLRPETVQDWLLDAASTTISNLVRMTVRPGAGSQFKTVPSAKGVMGGYLQVLKGKIQFTAHLEASESQLRGLGGTIFAVDSVGDPIAVEFVVGEGRFCLLPPPTNIPADRLGAAMVKVIRDHFNKSAQMDAPSWANEITVPGANVHDQQIKELTKQTEDLAAQIDVLRVDRENLLKYVGLLFGYGKAVLEPVVRSAFRLFGFTVPEPEEYQGEWDVELRDAGSGSTALGEVEGSEGFIDVDKYRQLLDYIEGETLEGREHKGILVGNGFRLLAPDASERQDQFSEHAKRGAARNEFCLLPTTELFKAVCAVLDAPEDQALKVSIRESLFATTGLWKFDPSR